MTTTTFFFFSLQKSDEFKRAVEERYGSQTKAPVPIDPEIAGNKIRNQFCIIVFFFGEVVVIIFLKKCMNRGVCLFVVL